MNQEFDSVAALLAHLQTLAGKAAECYCKIGLVSAELATRIGRTTGLNAAGFALALDRSGILHSFRKHGLANAASEIAQGQVPIENHDFERLSQWLANPPVVRPGQPRPGRQPQPCIEFEINGSDGRLTVVLEFRPGRKRLVVLTMYKKRPTA